MADSYLVQPVGYWYGHGEVARDLETNKPMLVNFGLFSVCNDRNLTNSETQWHWDPDTCEEEPEW